MEKTKICKCCNNVTPIIEMVKSKQNKDGIGSYCLKCMKVKSLEQRKKNPLRTMISNTKSSAKKRNIYFNLTEEDLVIPEYCKYLEIKLTINAGEGLIDSAATIDRIDNNKGYTKDNIQIISHKANIIKNNLSINDLILFLKNIEKFSQC
jgi:hypothetical protein